MGLDKFQVSRVRIYAILFDESEEGPFEVPPGRTNKCEIIKTVSGAPKLYIFGK